MMKKESRRKRMAHGGGFEEIQRTGGITILRPRTTVSVVMRLACLIAAVGTLYFALMPESVSPATTV